MGYWRPIITTQDHSGQQYRLSDDRARQWFSHYGADGSGFGYLTWRVDRPIGFDYPDLGYGFPVVMRKGPFRVIFSGQIARITERSSAQGDYLEIWALGWVHVGSADVHNKIYTDARLSSWVSSEETSGQFRPAAFDWDSDGRLRLKPRRNVDFVSGDYTYVRYTFPFGETARRITANYEIEIVSGWGGSLKLEIRDSNGVVLWIGTADGSGSIDEVTTGSPTYIEVRLYLTASGENTAEDGTVYVELTDVVVASTDETVIDVAVIAEDVVEQVLSASGHGLSTLTTGIASTGYHLTQAAFDRDMDVSSILTWCAGFGDSDGGPVAWGVTFDDTRRLFVEAQDLTTVLYVVRRRWADLEKSGDWGESAQVVYGVYSDESGEVVRTSDVQDDDLIARLGGFYRRHAMSLQGVTSDTQAVQAVTLWLDENKNPSSAGSFTVRHGVHSPEGRFVPFDEIVPSGGLVQVHEWRAREATMVPTDYRDNVTTFALAGVQVDEDNRTVELVPRQEEGKFDRYMAIIADLSGG